MAEFIRISEAAKRLGVTRARMYQIVEEKNLPTEIIFGTTAIDAALLDSDIIKNRRTPKKRGVNTKHLTRV